MKKPITILLAAMMILSLAACGAGNDTQTQTEDDTQQRTQTEEKTGQDAAEPTDVGKDDARTGDSVDGDTENSDTEELQETSDADHGTLVIYFSSANTADADTVSAATPTVDGLGATEYLAQIIHDQVGGDIAGITPEKDYPADYNGTLDEAKAERDRDERPAYLPLDVDPEDYDVIFIGYPIWWYTRPMLIYSFLDDYDLSGKTIIPFNTHAGSRDGGTYEEIREAEPDATVLDGLAVSGSSVGSETESTVRDWLSGLDY